VSHRATNWAILQRGLRPATKLVLWHLCDRHNPDHGCFPSQGMLAADVEMSRSALNEHLAILEREGLIRRERRIDPSTRKQMSTCYILGFETDFEREPCPDSGHGNGPEPCPENPESRVRNPDTNLVREPVTTTPPAASPIDAVEARCLDACGPGLGDEGRRRIAGTSNILGCWLEEGFDLEADILPIIRERTARERPTPIRTWDYFTEAIRQARRRRLARPASEGPAESVEHAERPPESEPGASEPVDHVERMAAWINSDAYVPPSAVSNTMRDELLARGLVTEAALRRRQIY
jgi:hypothetical protein